MSDETFLLALEALCDKHGYTIEGHWRDKRPDVINFRIREPNQSPPPLGVHVVESVSGKSVLGQK